MIKLGTQFSAPDYLGIVATPTCGGCCCCCCCCCVTSGTLLAFDLYKNVEYTQKLQIATNTTVVGADTKRINALSFFALPIIAIVSSILFGGISSLITRDVVIEGYTSPYADYSSPDYTYKEPIISPGIVALLVLVVTIVLSFLLAKREVVKVNPEGANGFLIKRFLVWILAFIGEFVAGFFSLGILPVIGSAIAIPISLVAAVKKWRRKAEGLIVQAAVAPAVNIVPEQDRYIPRSPTQ